MKHILCSK